MKINTTTTPTLTEWPVPFFSVSGVGPFCEANPHRMAIAISFLFLASCHSVRAGVPFFTGRQPSQNGHCHFFPGVGPFCGGWRPVFHGTRYEMVMFSHVLVHHAAIGSPSSRLISRPSEKSRMRWPDQGGRESWDWAEQKSLYKNNSPHKVGEETFVRMGACWRK